VLQGLPFHDSHVFENDQHALAVRMVAHCTDAWAVIDVAEAWNADRCAACGAACKPYPATYLQCGAQAVLARDNPFRRGVVLSWLHLRDSAFNHAWAAEERTDENGRFVAWKDVETGKPYTANPGGRFERPWDVARWMPVHIMVNLPVMARALGHEEDSRMIAGARKVEANAPPGFRFLRLNPERLKTSLRRVDPETLIK
jgi:hypothetical protein